MAQIEEISFDVEKNLTNLIKNICKFYPACENKNIKNDSIYVINKIVANHSSVAAKNWPEIYAMVSRNLKGVTNECTPKNLSCMRIMIDILDKSVYTKVAPFF